MARLNPRLAKINHNYTIAEVADLFGVHRNTVRAWIRSGLPTLSDERPFLILGSELRAFLVERRAKAKRPCPPGMLFCLKCRLPRRPARGMADFVTVAVGAGDLCALCEACGTVMHRRAQRDQVGAILPGCAVQFTEGQERIDGCPKPSPNSALKRDSLP